MDDQATLVSWAKASDFKRDFEFRVKGLSFAVYQWILMRCEVDTVKPDTHTRGYAEACLGRPLSDADVVDVIGRPAAKLGIPARSLDVVIWEYRSGNVESDSREVHLLADVKHSDTMESMTSISLMLAVEDAPTAAEWYRTALGATDLWSLGSVIGLTIKGAPFFLHEAIDNGFSSPGVIGQTTVRVEVFIDDPDSLFEMAIAAGATGSGDGIQDHQVPWGIHRQGACCSSA